MDESRVPLTPEGFARLQEDLKRWKEEMPIIIKAIGEARDLGDLSENAEYHSARERQGLIDANIKHLESLIARAEVIDPSRFRGDKRIRFGATVTIFDEDRDEEIVYRIVGDAEADIDRNMISVNAPLGRALIGKEDGDDVKFKTPRGERRLSIVAVEYV
ncbi:MAG TPA: transcription elongation factor GreA [Myxococcota bacterium]|nr:transcription elongation factor GreA [Myxococcota bacterium]HOA12430.1 transcription elongation factor GreA [Myxococcota bacterium]HOC99901.1 transcription elongation factor GreA [Myxococcota bacterium]HOH75735.1 transcription elongation factor GreA [Myxococcota bacterium]HPV03319.1 transcription elongation factor GreA [Myxococcota bacterium]